MRAIWIGLLAATLASFSAPVRSQAPETAGPNVSANLKDVPLRDALAVLFKNSGYNYTVLGTVKNSPVNLNVNQVNFQTALRLLISQAAGVQPGLRAEKQGNTFHIYAEPVDHAPPTPELRRIIEKVSVQFLDVEELEKQLQGLPVPEGIVKTQPLRADNALLIQGTPDAIQGLKQLLQLIDVPARTLTIHIGVTGPGVGNRPLQLGSMARTLNGKEVLLEDETTAMGEMARIRVQVKPVVQGDRQVLVHSEWDISVPVAGGPKGPIRLVKRLTTNARLQPGRGVTVGEVDLAPFGGDGTVRLWLRAEVLPDVATVRASTDAGEPLGHVEVLGNKPYISAFGLADLLNGRLKRGARGGFEVAPGPDPNPGALLKVDRPENSGPFRLAVGDRTITDALVFGLIVSEDGRLEPDPEGEPFVPLEDLAAALFARLTYDSAKDAYQFRGGHRLSTLRFPTPPKAVNR